MNACIIRWKARSVLQCRFGGTYRKAHLAAPHGGTLVWVQLERGIANVVRELLQGRRGMSAHGQNFARISAISTLLQFRIAELSL